MFDYTVLPYCDEKAFYKICDTIEHKFSPIDKNDLLEDVDGSLIQIFYHNGKN